MKRNRKPSQEVLDEELQEQPRILTSEQQTDTQTIYGLDQDGNSIFLKIILHQNQIAEITLCLRLNNGHIYKLPSEPQTVFHSTSPKKWKAEGLTITIIEPFRRIRILYNGLLRDSTSQSELNEQGGNVEHVKFNFIWNAADKPLYYSQEVSSHSSSRTSHRNRAKIECVSDEVGYEQYGALQGFVSGETFPKDWTLYLASFRKRYWGTTENFELDRDCSIFVVAADGTLFNVGTKLYKNSSTRWKYGTLLDNIANIYSVDKHDMSLPNLEGNNTPDEITINLKAKGRTHKCIINVNHQNTSTTYGNALKGWELKTVTSKCKLNTQNGYTIAHFWQSKEGVGADLPYPLLREPEMDCLQFGFTARFTNPQCRVASLAGGKGSSLALSFLLNSCNFTIPDGFVILTTAFNYQLQQNEKLKQSITDLENVCSGKIEKDPAKACQKTVDLFSSEPINQEIVTAVLQELNSFPKKSASGDASWRWAVRSSGISEDSEELSCAGQNATVLGCGTKDDILRAVAECWGSLFTFQSVQYRRQHGLEVNSSIAVVIQRMVSAETSGVLFSCHPTTGDPSKIVITANYGLGESVVSGQIDPDTIVLSRTWLGVISMHSQEIGTKKKFAQMPPRDSETRGTELIETDFNLANTLCITQEQALLLGQVGIELEKAFGSPRDIEWAFYKKKLYLLQSRPITTFNTWSDFELLHEFDTPVLTEEELLTVANMAEVMPGALTPLSNSTISRVIGNNVYKNIMETAEEPFVQKITGTVNHHAVINVINSFHTKLEDRITIAMKVSDIAVFGHPVVNEEIYSIARARFGILSKFSKMRLLFNIMKDAANIGKYANKTTRIASQLNVPIVKKGPALYMMDTISRSLSDLGKVSKYHGRATHVSVFFQIVAMHILAHGSDDLTIDHYYDISLILSSCSKIISAEVPKILENISNTLREEDIHQNFVNVDPNDGINWLRLNCPNASTQLDAFLEEHGHRGLREFEIKEDSWAMNPAIIIGMLQANCKGAKQNKSSGYLSAEDAVAKLITPRNNIVRKILKIILKKCRNSVGQREKTKSETVRVINEIRIAFRGLARQMVLEGTIPDPNLIYYFSFYELKQVVTKKEPNLVQKAMRRQRLYPQWDKLKLPELIFGVPKLGDRPVEAHLRTSESHVVLTGTPISSGDVAGRACVITDLENIGKLETGDILITYSTDIGWSAYFPLLAAVVTELGGLISHGAVVAREYGLPCIVGVQNATSVFKTGDEVFLSGRSGTIELITPSANTN